MSSSAPSSNSSAAPSAAEFDTLRREATKLERQLEDRIGRYQQLAQRITSDATNGVASSTSSSGANHSLLLDSAESGTMSTPTTALFAEESTLSTEIDRLISSFSDLNDRMARAAERSKKNQHLVLVKRYREILFDFQSDFQKVKATIARRRDTLELFSNRSGAGGGSGMYGGEGENSDMEHLLRERGAIDNSMNSAASIIGQAGEIHGDLREQRRALTGITGKMAGIASTIPGVNKLIDAIRKKRNRDDWVVTGVVAACVVFTLWYVFVA